MVDISKLAQKIIDESKKKDARDRVLKVLNDNIHLWGAYSKWKHSFRIQHLYSRYNMLYRCDDDTELFALGVQSLLDEEFLFEVTIEGNIIYCFN